jgi:LacI family transcriptional regulator
MNMETPSGHLTLKEIAREAGVSVATIDRVMHGRKGVREETARRVRDAIARHSRSVGEPTYRARAMKFAFVMPVGANIFMQMVRDNVGEMSEWLSLRKVSVEMILTDVFSATKLSETLESLVGRFDGVAVVALDHQGVRAAIDDLVASGVFVVTLVSDVPAARRHHYVGIDNVAAGRTAGTLVGRLSHVRVGKIGIIAGSQLLRDHAERVFGFQQVMGLEHAQFSLLAVVEGSDQDDLNEMLVAKLLVEHPDLVGVYNVGAGTAGVAKALTDAGRENEIVFVAHDLTPFTRRSLLRGVIDAVISQDAGHEARSAIRVLMALGRGEPMLSEQEKIRIDIVMRDNLP